MKSVDSLQPADAALPVSADSLREFHAARLLLLLRYAGQDKGRIESLTKMAKLDFFVRYPKFLRAVTSNSAALAVSGTESPMIRFHYFFDQGSKKEVRRVERFTTEKLHLCNIR